MPHKEDKHPARAVANQHDMLYPILVSVYDEIKELSKKKPDGVLNEMKVKMANRILSKVKFHLQDDTIAEFLDPLDEEILPTHSEAVMVISQYKAAMEQYKSRHYSWSSAVGGNDWFTQGN